MIHADAAQAAGEGHKRRVAAAASYVVVVGTLAGVADVVQDDACRGVGGGLKGFGVLVLKAP